MEKTYKIASVFLTFALLFSIAPITTFAVSNLNPNAAFTITDKQGKEVVLQYDYLTKEFTNFPQNGDVIKVFYNGNTGSAPDESYVYNGEKFDGNNDNLKLRYEVAGADFSSSTVDLRLFRKEKYYYTDSDWQFDITSKKKVAVVRAPLKSFTYSPSRIRLDSEHIKITAADGSTMYKFSKRTKKTPEGYDMESENAIGDQAIVTLQDGTTTTYNSKFTSQDGSYGIKFVNDKGETLRVYVKPEQNELFRGENTVSLFIPKNPEITTNINVFVWTPDMGTFPGDYGPSESKTTPVTKNKDSETASKPAANVQKINIAAAKLTKAKRSGKRIILNWKGMSKKQLETVSKIQVQYSKNKNFKAKNWSVYVKKSKKSYKTGKLKKGKYYVRIRNMRQINGKKHYSKWSAVKSVKIR